MKQRKVFLPILLSILLILLATASSLLNNAIILPSLVRTIALPLLGITTLAAIGIGVWQFFLQRKEIGQALRSPTARDRAELIHLLDRDYRRQLTQLLQKPAITDLEVRELPDMIRSSAQVVSWNTHTPNARSYISIIEAHDEASHGMLLLGGPGAGKSTLLLKLACELLTDAEGDSDQPVPIVVNLSSWAIKKLSLVDWLVDEIWVKYLISRPLSRAWLEQDQLLVLLDGLNEVATVAQPACIEAINTYHGEHFVPLVVCSRREEYLAQATQLTLSYTLEVQPLTPQQVDRSLREGGKSFAAVRTILKSNKVLTDLVTTPLMLRLVLSTYDNEARGLPRSDIVLREDQQHQVFEHYVRRMLERQGRFTAQQTRQWLTWLARQLQQRHLTDFYLERLQPDWLPTKRAQRYYFFLTAGLPLALIIWLPFGLLVFSSSPTIFILILWFAVALALMLFSVAIWLGCGLENLQPERDQKKSWRLFSKRLTTWLGIEMKEIQPREVIGWSWKPFWETLGKILAFGLLIGVLGGVFGGHFSLLLGLLVFTLIVGLLIGSLRGLSSTSLRRGIRSKPNQGIRASGWTALRVGFPLVLGGLIAGVLISILVGLTRLSNGETLLSLPYGWVTALLFGLLEIGLPIGLVAGLFGGLTFGGIAYLKHYLLRYLLWRRGVTPWHYVRFLEEMTDHNLLQSVGGGYRFFHPLLQDYFASQGPGATSSSAPSL